MRTNQPIINELVTALEGPVAARPRHIVQLGCGDGALLRQIAQTVANRHPVTLVGIDPDEALLAETRRSLEGTPHLTLRSGLDDPRRLLDDLRKEGVSNRVVFLWTAETEGSFAGGVEWGANFLLAAAGAGLQPVAGGVNRRLDDESGPGATLVNCEQRDYQIRPAAKADLPALERLENACWPGPLRTPSARLTARIEGHAGGQLVLVLNDLVVGVVYSQRIHREEDISGLTMWTADKLHQSSGACVQLLGISILPEWQQRKLGDELLEFILQRSVLLTGVERVIGVTRCKDYGRHREIDPARFIRLRNDRGGLLDATLRFHERHGAEIAGLVPGYRPEDDENRGFGVLVRYQLKERRPIPDPDPEPAAAPVLPDKDTIAEFVKAAAGALVAKDGVEARAVPVSRPLTEIGLGSCDLMELRERINHHFGISLETSFFFEHNTLSQIIAALEKRLAAISAARVEAGTKLPPKRVETAVAVREGDIAIVGMALRLPGGCRDAAGFWQLLSQGKSAVGTAPAGRFDWPDEIDPKNGHAGIDQGGFLDDIAGFDAEFFRISPKEAGMMDPQQRLLLELSWECVEDAGYAAGTLAGSKTGVFIGASGSDYGKVIGEEGIEIEAHTGLGLSMAIVPNRISYFFDFCGPSLLIDTACSSSLVAVHEAVRSLRAGECAQALVGGVNILCHAGGSVAYYKAGMVSKDGNCKTFDERANGYVRAEGGAVILLKPLGAALRDRDNIRAVIKGSAVNHGGRANGLTVPHPKRQAALVVAAFRDAGVDPASVGYIEAHGTGTPLGDPIEISGLKQAFAELSPATDRPGTGKCGLGSVKTNVGHLEAAAGLAGLLKVVLALKHRTIPATLNFTRLNPHISLEGSPFHIVSARAPWIPPDGQSARRAGVSSFGWGGANAHVVLEEAPAVSQTSLAESKPRLFTFSAKNGESLRRTLAKFLTWLENEGTATDPLDVSATLLVGREHWSARVAVVAQTPGELKIHLRSALEREDAGGTWFGDGISGERLNLGTFAQRYVQGENLDFSGWFGGELPRRVALPAYGFSHIRYWVLDVNQRKRRTEKEKVETTLWRPVWSGVEVNAGNKDAENEFDRLIILCDFGDLVPEPPANGLNGARLITFQSTAGREDERLVEYAERLLETLRAILQSPPRRRILVQLVIPGAGDGPLLSGLSGGLMTAHDENPRLVGQTIIFERGEALDSIWENLAECGRDLEGSVIRFRGGLPAVRRWSEVALVSRIEAGPWKDNGVYLIIGGTGGLGRIFAREITARVKTPKVILAGRSAATRERLAAIGDGAEYRRVDVTQGDQVTGLIDGIRSEFGRLDGIINCAGIIRDNFIIRKTTDELREVAGAKVTGCANLERALHGVELDFLVLFSSVSGALGNAGQFDYAIANASEDAFAECHQGLAGRVLSINWPLWKDGGMRVSGATEGVMRDEWGSVPLETQTGLEAFYRAFASGVSRILVLAGDRRKIETRLGDNPKPARVNAHRQPAAPAQGFAGALRVLLAGVIGTDPAGIDPKKTFDAYGVDSILMTELNQKLGAVFGEISKTLLYEHDTLEALTAFLAEEYPAECARWSRSEDGESTRPGVGTLDPDPRKDEARPRDEDAPHEPIAIIGISARFPGANHLADFWENLKAGGINIGEVPTDRWNGEQSPDPDPAGRGQKWGGFLRGVHSFDPLFFGMTPREAAEIDPQERLFLEECWKALEDAGYSAPDLPETTRKKTGVFAGITKQGFNLTRSPSRLPVTSFASLANRVSYHLDLQGPSMPVDTMCSSALVAIHEACRYLRSGGELAIAGGVNLYLHSSNFAKLAADQLLSGKSRSDPFGKQSDGFIPGEGVGALVLKPLSKARRDGDEIRALIRGTAVNHGGKTSGYTTPNARQLAAVIRDAMEDAGIDPRTVGYIETAANGSPTGDAVEAAALAKAFGRRDASVADSYLMGSVKPNIGHPESASGIAQIAKVMLAMNHKTLPPTALGDDFECATPVESMPFQLARKTYEWKPIIVDGVLSPRRAGITGVGAGGVNAHVVMDEYLEPASVGESSGNRQRPALFVLSATTAAELRAYIREWLDYLAANPGADLRRLAYTTQVGRAAMPGRLAIVASSVEELARKLGDRRMEYGNGGPSVIRPDPDEIAAAVNRGDLELLASIWERGGVVPWPELYSGEIIARLGGLPTYPFARRECLIERAGDHNGSPSEELKVAGAGVAVNRAVEFYTAWAIDSKAGEREDYLTFCPFEQQVPGFSMSRVFLSPKDYPDEWRFMRERQIEMRQVLFRDEDFSRIHSVFDIGCGLGTDVIGIARSFPHIRADGYTLTAIQAELANNRIATLDLGGRARVFHADSAMAPYPGQYDLVLGIEVTFHIRNKEQLFRNIAACLRPGGRVLLMDFLANQRGAIVDSRVEISVPTKREWIELLSRHGLLVTAAVDVSPQIANFLRDPEYGAVTREAPEVVRDTIKNYANQSKSLEKGWISYCLLTMEKCESLDFGALTRQNKDRLDQLTPYPNALAAMLERGPAAYPQGLDAPTDLTRANPAPRAQARVGRADEATVTETVIGLCVAEFGFQRAEIRAGSAFRDLAVGSVEAVTLTEAVNRSFDLDLPTSVIFESGTISRFSSAVCDRLERSGREMAPPTKSLAVPAVNRTPEKPGTPPREFTRASSGEIAVVGLSLRCAGATGPDDLWDLVREGRDCSVPIEDPRWLEVLQKNLTDIRGFRKCAMADRDGFDGAFFNVSPKEALLMDVSQRLVLEECYKALEDAGCTPDRLRQAAVGTFIGTSGWSPGRAELSHFSMLGGDASILASRIAHYLDLRGPAMAVNAACASALAAIDLAVQKLMGGEIDLALAGGVTVFEDPSMFVRMHKAGLLSPSGKCRPFDEDADGFLVGDGIGIVVLKRLADAERDGDPIYGVICGVGCNHNGQTFGLTVPSASAQSELVTGLYRKRGLDAGDVQYVETNGTGTKLGDSIEFEALCRSYREFTQKSGFCTLGSLKANIGNTAAASGGLALIKVLLALKNRQLPPLAGFSKASENADLQGGPFVVNAAVVPWPVNARGQRLAALSSFGFNGTNYHLLVRDHPTNGNRPANDPNDNVPRILLLSAETPGQLRQYAANVSRHLTRQPEANLADVLFSFQTGRRFHSCRLAVVVSDREALVRELDEFATSGTARAGRVYNSTGIAPEVPSLDDTPAGVEFLERLIQSNRSDKLAQLWASGAISGLPAGSRGGGARRVLGLPSFPFSRSKPAEQPVAATTGNGEPATEHQPSPGLAGELTLSLGKLLSISAADLSPGKPFSKIGVDSIVATEWVGELSRRYGVCVSLEAFHEHPSIGQLAGWLISQGVPPNPEPPAVPAISSNGGASPIEVTPRSEGDVATKSNGHVIRPAQASDVAGLTILGRSIYLEGLSGTAAELEARLKADSGAQFVVEVGGRLVGAIYTRAAGSIEDVYSPAPGETGKMRGNGDPAIQHLISLDLLPEYQQSGLGGELLDFALTRAASTAATASMVHIARCERFSGKTAAEFGKYIAELERLEFELEPTLRLHHERGGKIRGVIANYRPADRANLGFGVLIEHQLRNGARQREANSSSGDSESLAKRVGRLMRELPEIVPLTLKGDGRCTFWLHPMSGEVGVYHKLAAQVGGDFRMIGIQARGFLRSSDEPINNLPRMAGHYADIICAAQSDGPYHLAGFSFGGSIAYEVARELQTRGKLVASLVLIEAPFISEEVASMATMPRRANLLMNANFLLLALLTTDSEFAGQLRSGAEDFRKYRITGEEIGSVAESDLVETLVRRCRELGVKQAPETLKKKLVSMTDVHAANLCAVAGHRTTRLPQPNAVRCLAMRTREGTVTSSLVLNPPYLEEAQRRRGSLLAFMEGWKLVLPHLETAVLEGANHFELFHHDSSVASVRKALVSFYQDFKREKRTVDCGTSPNGNGASARSIANGTPSRLTPKSPVAPAGAIAVIGISGRFPDAANVDEFWRNLQAGRNSVKEAPRDRGWDINDYFDPRPQTPGKTYCKRGGFLDGVDGFDPLFFGISPVEAEFMDPSERIFLQEAWRAIEDAGYAASSLKRKKWGVFACVRGDYASVVQKYHPTFLAPTDSSSPARLSYALDLVGPAVSIDTACSSGLAAIAQACDSLTLRNCDTAIVGAGGVYATPNMLVTSSQSLLFSPEGQCYTFDSRANGTVLGEAIAVAVLKRLDDAIADGDPIYGVIKAWGGNQNGRTNGLTAPSSISQAALQTEVYERFGIDPSKITMLEAHGTGTKLGDPIEFQALRESFARYTKRSGFCALGSLKTNIGHPFAAAGLAGLIKVLMALKHRQIPASLNFEKLNPYIQDQGSPFFVNTKLIDWEVGDGTPRLAGINSFGATGINIHVVVEEFQMEGPRRADFTGGAGLAREVMVVSAKDADRLRDVAAALLDWLRTNRRGTPQPQESLADIAFTLQVARDAMDARLAFVAESLEEMETKLGRFLAGNLSGEGVFHGVIEANRAGASPPAVAGNGTGMAGTWMEQGMPEKAAEFWVRGGRIDWTGIQRRGERRRIHLPGYVFVRERYWIGGSSQARSEAGATGGPALFLHPLLQRNTSVLDQQQYSSLFSGREFFLADHVIGGEKLLPGVAYLEIAREAVARAVPGVGADEVLVCLKNAVWLRPFAVGVEGREIQVAMSALEGGEIELEIYSTGPASGDARVVHSQIRVELRDVPPARPQRDLDAMRANRAVKTIGAVECYAAFERKGVQYGPGHRGVESIYVGENRTGSVEVLAKLSLPKSIATDAKSYVLHPGMLDSALQASIGLAYGPVSNREGAGQQLSLPFAVDRVEIFGGCEPEMWACITACGTSTASDAVRKSNIDLCDAGGRVLVRLEGLASRVIQSAPGAVPPGASSQVETALFAPKWEVRKTGAGPVKFKQRIVVLAGFADANALHLRLSATGREIIRADRPEGGANEQFTGCAREVFRLLRARVRGGAGDLPMIQIVVPADGEGQLFSALTGLLKTAERESSGLAAQLIEVASEADPAVIAGELDECAGRPGQKHCRLSGGKVWTPEWVRLDSPGPDWVRPWRDGGVYLITGGAGGLGLLFATEIARQCARPTLVLAGRSAPDARLESRMTGLRELGATVVYEPVDVGQRSEVDGLLKRLLEQHGALHGILHAAGVARDKLMVNKPEEDFIAVMSPKVAGTVNLDEAAKNLPLDFFVLFSSGAAVVGNVGQADYATANAFMDGYARRRSELVGAGARRGRTLSVNWPLWAEGGMRVSRDSVAAMFQATGVTPLASASGIIAFYQAMASGEPQVMVIEGELHRVLKGTIEPEIESRPERRGSDPAGKISPTRDSVPSEKAVEYFKASLASMLKLPAHRIDPGAPFEKYGIDSILATSFTNQLEKEFGSLSKTLFFEYQSVEALAGYFVDKHGSRMSELLGLEKQNGTQPIETTRLPLANESRRRTARLPVKDQPHVPSRRRADESGVENEGVAIIGLSGRFPGARDLAEFWELLREGRDGITEIPKERWDNEKHFDGSRNNPGKTYSKWGGFIHGVDQFDPLFFQISPREAALIDPKERLFLETVWTLFESAGLTRETLREQYEGRGGVFVGAMYQDYHCFASDWINESLVSLSSYSSIANRVSHYFDLRGPSVAIDTMCSSALTAIKLACDSLAKGECSIAVAGAANLSIHPKKYVGLSLGRMIGSKAESRSFSNGDGYIPGEAVGAVLLKPMAAAVRDGDRIMAVIRAVNINHGGRSNGFSVPNLSAQASLIRDTFKRSGIDPRTISCVEAAANGSSLGDPIELAALRKAFGEFTSDRSFCSIGSVKSNIGHAEAASGMAQLAKVVLQLQHKELAPSIKAEPLNPGINFDDSPFRLQRERQNWDRPMLTIDGIRREIPRRASISSFGAGGSNAHLIIEEYDPPRGERNLGEGVVALLMVFSARTEERLGVSIGRMLVFLEAAGDLPLVDIAHTLQEGREAMECRLALVVSTREELIGSLREWLAAKENGGKAAYSRPVWTGNINSEGSGVSGLLSGRTGKLLLEALIAERDLEKLAVVWVNGGRVPWRELNRGGEPRMVELPGYPFDRRRCWIEPAGPESTEAPIPTAESAASGTPVKTSESKAEIVVNILIRMLGVTAAELDLERPLDQYGFDSIMLTQFAQQIQTKCGTVIDLASLRERLTAQSLIDELSLSRAAGSANGKENGKQKYRELVCLRQREKGAPIFWFHAGIGGVEAYHVIAEGSGRTFYGIQARGWMNEDAPLRGIPAMAGYYAEIVRSTQPNGPYDLGGYSMGGALAYEVARHLQAGGESVRSIVMLDTLDGRAVESFQTPEKTLYLQAVNTTLAAANLRREGRPPVPLIHRDEVAMDQSDTDYLDRLVASARGRGLDKNENYLRSVVDQMAKVQRAYEYDKFTVAPLPRPGEIDCYYFRNKSGRFFGDFEPFFSLAPTLAPMAEYWEDWVRHLPRLQMIDVESSCHMTMLAEPASLSVIAELCQTLYSGNPAAA